MQAYGVFAGSVRRQATVYAGLRRVPAADIIGRHRRRARRNLRAYVRANWGAVRRRAYTQIPKAGEASRRRRAAVRRRAYTQMPPSVHDCGRRSTVRTYSVRNQALSMSPAERFRWLAEVLKEALCAQSCAHKWTSSLGKQTAARAGSRRKQTLSVVTGDDLDKIAHLRADGRLHTQAWCANGCRPQCATAADEPPRKSTGV